MTDLVVRRLLVDMDAPIARHWCAGDPFRTAFFNALSMSFPVGEQFFIDAVRAGHQALPAALREKMQVEVQGFVGQEATHRRLHGLYNQHLDRLGLVNRWAQRAQARLKLFDGADPRHPLAVTAANEHFTSILAHWLLTHPQVVDCEDQRLSTLWLWHSAEEAEHRSTAFDVYRALGGNEVWRLHWFRRVTLFFVYDLAHQTALNLWRDGTFWRWRTWKSAATFLFGQQGLLRGVFKPWRDYLRHDFHPSQHDAQVARQWLQAHRTAYVPVSGWNGS